MPYDFTDFTRHMAEITVWYQALLTGLYPDGPDRQAKELIVDHRNEFAELAATDASPAVGVAAVQWNRAVLILADAERDLGRPGWRPEWTDVYEYYLPGNDAVLGPFGAAGPE
ncbi:hypothetical protein [Streptomyces sp. 769]|uniref:hypothetical protein n=1 Tax=Streptomyces sp. 769 TaxID=1262452 RepID=UPI000581D63A|nr:hypothetical protein [Streptomyces sp. 769]AJC61935.1 hypothetical protein GZL_p00005 [Streptomyces sp. 769]AJC62158.1 hypothetical protein GZL_p00228 [Streptomyces sp. 769]